MPNVLQVKPTAMAVPEPAAHPGATEPNPLTLPADFYFSDIPAIRGSRAAWVPCGRLRFPDRDVTWSLSLQKWRGSVEQRTRQTTVPKPDVLIPFRDTKAVGKRLPVPAFQSSLVPALNSIFP